MNLLKICVLAGFVLVPHVAAAAQGVEGIACTGGELSLVSGPAFSAVCTGDLRIDASSVIEADESIALSAVGSLSMAGRLVAPRIELVAGAEAYVFGGLFSGSPDFYPDVNAVSYAGSLTVSSRNFHDLVPRPYIDPVFGAVIFTLVVSLPMADVPSAVMHEFILIPDESVSPVPEPGQFALFAAGLGLVAWKRRAAGRMSRTAHAVGNRNVTLEN